jgi:hypothetical protein
MNFPNLPSGRLAIEYLPIAQLQPDPRNARLHKPPQIAAIARSMRTFGFNVPLLIDGEGRIIAGHGRMEAAKKNGLVEVPVIRIEHLSEAQRTAYMIADNRLTDLSRWDEQVLGETLRDLSLAELDFELDAIGFSVGEIDLRIESVSDSPISTDDDKLPELTGEPVTLPGDLWYLGTHRLLCGDALQANAWERLMQGQLAAVGFTDPPYNVPVDGFVSGLGSVRHREFAMAAGEMDRDEFVSFLETSLEKYGPAFGEGIHPFHRNGLAALGRAPGRG